MRFTEIPGHENLKHQLKAMVSQNRLSHALLFCGKEGSGALPMAMAFAQYLVCERRNPGTEQAEAGGLFEEPAKSTLKTESPLDDSCGVCPACRKSAAIAHPDIHFSFPVI